jgi:hypothetical protein
LVVLQAASIRARPEAATTRETAWRLGLENSNGMQTPAPGVSA